MKMNADQSEKIEEVIRLPSELPSGWKKTSLAEAAEIIMGQSPPSEFYNATGKGLPFFQGKAEFGELYPEAVKWCSVPGKIALKGDVLISVRAPVGPTNLAPAKCCIGRGLAAIRPRDGVPSKYILHYLRSIESDIDSLGTGTTFKAISGKTLREIPIPIAPPEQQKRIVAEIEKQFSRLDEAVANLKRVKANLKRYKAAVLKAAVEGRLVFDDATSDRSVQSDISAKMERKQIGSAIESLDQGWSPKCENAPAQNDDDWSVMKTTAVQPLQYLAAENKRLPASLKPRAHLELVAGDLLITRAGPRSRVGVTCLVRATRPRIMLCDKVYRLRCKHDVAAPVYLELVLNSPEVVDALNELKTGISDSGVNLTQKRFQELLVPIPPLREQHRIVAEVDRRLSLTREVEAQVDANLQRAERLRQAVLSQAFSGGLCRECAS